MTAFERRLLWASSAFTGATGVAYWWMKNFVRPADPWAVIHHPLEPWMLKAHIVAAPVLVFSVGLVASSHVWRKWRGEGSAGRRSGALAMWLFTPMVLSGYLIQAVTEPGWLRALAWVHLGTGAGYLLGFVAHLRIFRAGGGRGNPRDPAPAPRDRG